MAGGIPKFAAFKTPSATQLNALVAPTVFKASTEGRTSNTTFTNDAELFCAVEANSTYSLFLSTNYSAIAAAGLKVNFSLPAGAAIDAGTFWHMQSGVASMDFHTGSVVGITPNNSSAKPFLMTGRLTVGATAGTCQFQFAQQTSSASTTFIYAGSYLQLIKIG